MLTLSARGDYGLMFLKHLSALAAGQYATVRAVAESQKLPLKYLERVAAALASAGIVTSREGQGGGYALAKPAAQVPLAQVLEVLEGALEPVVCTHDGTCCSRSAACERKTGWQAVHGKLYQVLAQHSLADILLTIK